MRPSRRISTTAEPSRASSVMSTHLSDCAQLDKTSIARPPSTAVPDVRSVIGTLRPAPSSTSECVVGTRQSRMRLVASTVASANWQSMPHFLASFWPNVQAFGGDQLANTDEGRKLPHRRRHEKVHRPGVAKVRCWSSPVHCLSTTTSAVNAIAQATAASSNDPPQTMPSQRFIRAQVPHRRPPVLDVDLRCSRRTLRELLITLLEALWVSSYYDR